MLIIYSIYLLEKLTISPFLTTISKTPTSPLVLCFAIIEHDPSPIIFKVEYSLTVNTPSLDDDQL